jgi:hypothetical protein
MNSCRFSRTASLIAVVALAGTLITACGSSPKPSASNGNSGPSFKKLTADAYKQSVCMRDHGVTNFPDPTVVSNSHQQMIGIHITPGIANSPSFKHAQKACAHLMPAPQGGNTSNGPSAAEQKAHTDGLLAFAACMRTHGFPRFPDPNGQGQLTPQMLSKAGVSLQQPAVRPAANTCTASSHGQVTKADVAQAIENPNGSGSQASAGG